MVVNQAAPEGDSIVSPTPVDGYTGVVIGGGGGGGAELAQQCSRE